MYCIAVVSSHLFRVMVLVTLVVWVMVFLRLFQRLHWDQQDQFPVCSRFPSPAQETSLQQVVQTHPPREWVGELGDGGEWRNHLQRHNWLWVSSQISYSFLQVGLRDCSRVESHSCKHNWPPVNSLIQLFYAWVTFTTWLCCNCLTVFNQPEILCRRN